MGDPRFRGVIFDFDGTLVDSYDAITASVNHVRAAHRLPPLPEGEVRRMVGHGLMQLLAEIVPGGNPETDAVLYRSHHQTVLFRHTRLLPGVTEALEALDRAGVRMAVCSNKMVAFTRQLVEALGIARHFRTVLGPDDVGRTKPDPAMVHEALRRLGVSAAESLYVGDMTVDIQTARAAGMAVWVVPSGSNDIETLRAAHPDRILHGMADLPAAFLDG